MIKTRSFFHIQKVKAGLARCIYQICTEEELNINKDNFRLEDYHKYVTEEKHLDIINREMCDETI